MPGMASAIGELRSATICLAYVTSSADMGSPLRSLRRTTFELPGSSLSGVDCRLLSRLTYSDATVASTSMSARESTVR